MAHTRVHFYIPTPVAKRAVDVERIPEPPAPVKNQHVIPTGDGWMVRSSRARHATSVHATFEEAMDAAKKITGWPHGAAEVIFHSRNGRYRHILSKSPADIMLMDLIRDMNARPEPLDD